MGHHPLIFRIACTEIPPGQEFNHVGAVAGEPMKLIKEEITGLPMPADSEIVIAGFCPPDKTRPEGPFGEWTGYYGEAKKRPVIKVDCITYRNDPIFRESSLPE